MKKFITLAIALVAIVSQSASIDWKIGSKRNTSLFDTTGEKFNGTAYLVLASDVADLTSGSFADLQSEIEAKKLDSVAMSGGTYAVAQRTATSEALEPRVEYTYQLLLVDSVNESFALSATATLKSYELGVDDARIIGFNDVSVGAAANAGASTTSWQSFGGGDTPTVPEPATGALALAGLALLFRRRHA